MMLHFGEQDAHIPRVMWTKSRRRYREVQIYTYPAGHAFNRQGSAGYSGILCACGRASGRSRFCVNI